MLPLGYPEAGSLNQVDQQAGTESQYGNEWRAPGGRRTGGVGP
jgi:hypothetical protein